MELIINNEDFTHLLQCKCGSNNLDINIKWQPIQTAPKDREVLIASYDAGIKVAEWDEDREVWTYGCVATDWNYYLDAYKPTHWMELPDKPKDGE